MIINHNMSAMFSNRQLGVTQGDVAKSIEKLSSGQRINRASDDASGLAVSEKMRSQIRGLNQAERNIQNGVSFIQVTEGYLQETQDILHRLRELSVQSANGIYTDEDRMQVQVEVSQLVDEINRVASHAQYNGMNILTGSFAQNSAVNRVMQLQDRPGAWFTDFRRGRGLNRHHHLGRSESGYRHARLCVEVNLQAAGRSWRVSEPV